MVGVYVRPRNVWSFPSIDLRLTRSSPTVLGYYNHHRETKSPPSKHYSLVLFEREDDFRHRVSDHGLLGERPVQVKGDNLISVSSLTLFYSVLFTRS